MMRRSVCALGVLTLTVFAAPLLAEEVPTPGTWGKLGHYGAYYKTETETTFEAKVLGETRIPFPRNSGSGCLALQVLRDGIPCTVYLGPESYLKRKGLRLAPGDVVSVLGSDTVVHGQRMVLARELTKEGEVLKIRGKSGKHL
jgi:hypothetical protein